MRKYSHSVATGPACSGTRLLHRILQAAGVDALHDASHGTKQIKWADKVVVIIRDRAITKKAQIKHHRQPRTPSYDESLKGIRTKYPHAMWITYENLIAKPQRVINEIVKYLGVQPFEFNEPIYDGNKKY